MELVLNSFGTSLSRDNEGFVISYKEGKQRIPSDSISSIIISKGAQITSDAVLLAIEKEIEVLFTDKTGSPIGRVWSHKYGSISLIRKGQLHFSFSKEAIEWVKEIIQQKIENQQALLLTLLITDDIIKNKVNKSISRLEDYKSKVATIEGEIISDIAATLRGWEGVSSKIYFETLNLFLPETYRFEKRSKHPATDVMNALLNYGYGILYGKIEGALIKAGIDPYVGVFHRDDYNRPVLVYDIIELYRIWIDYVVYSLIIQDAITEEYFSIHEDGSYWLEGLGKRVLIQSVDDYLGENIQISGLTRSRQHHIFLYAQQLAQKFKQFK